MKKELRDKIINTLRELQGNEVYLFVHNSSGDAGNVDIPKPFRTLEKVADEVVGYIYSQPIVESVSSESVYIMQRGSTTEVSILELV